MRIQSLDTLDSYKAFNYMETLIAFIDILLRGTIIAIPFLIYIILKKTNVKQFGFYYFLTGIVLSALIICSFAWWVDTSNIILLKYYGYNLQRINTPESYENVLPQNIQKVKNIEKSVMGIG